MAAGMQKSLQMPLALSGTHINTSFAHRSRLKNGQGRSEREGKAKAALNK
jgi:hypothetical protein